MKNTLIRALIEQKESEEKELQRIALEMVRIKKENDEISESLREAYNTSCKHMSYFKKAILHMQRSNELPKDFAEELLLDDARLKECLFDYAKGINEKHLRECGVL